MEKWSWWRHSEENQTGLRLDARGISDWAPNNSVHNVSSRLIASTTASVVVAVSQSVQSVAPAEAARTGGSRARVRMPRPTSPQSECRSWRQRP